MITKKAKLLDTVEYGMSREELEKKICYSGQIIALFVSNNYYIRTAKGI
ncbi:hypothetical protein ACR79N_02975 [Sphingobacterium siyangense]|jgi:hypothetical protein|nr:MULTISPECIES: hypothetical protein [Sphingobacterium]